MSSNRPSLDPWFVAPCCGYDFRHGGNACFCVLDVLHGVMRRG